MLVAWFAYFVVGQVEGWTREVLQQVNIMGRFGEFARGQVALDGVIFFIAAAFLFVFLTVKVVESRRWR